jgi:LAS superfamily LD-carboxypeptidase LdcB
VTPAELTGTARSHIVDVADPRCALHAHVVAPFLNLRNAAAADGFDLVPVSSFRDFARQLAIWNGKFSGAAPLYDESGRMLVAEQLPPPERVAAILQWSALPGASRHHWGTDLDLIDRRATASGYRVQSRRRWSRRAPDGERGRGSF